MSKANCLIVLSAAVCVGLMVASGMHAQEDPPAPGVGAVQWQHLALTREVGENPAAHQGGAEINKLGREGWELVDVETFTTKGTTSQVVYYFRKRK